MSRGISIWALTESAVAADLVEDDGVRWSKPPKPVVYDGLLNQWARSINLETTGNHGSHLLSSLKQSEQISRPIDREIPPSSRLFHDTGFFNVLVPSFCSVFFKQNVATPGICPRSWVCLQIFKLTYTKPDPEQIQSSPYQYLFVR